MEDVEEEKDVFERMDEINFVPVLTGWNHKYIKSQDEFESKMTFIRNDTEFQYNKWLVNPYHDYKSWIQIIEDKKDKINFNDSIVFADSGGRQEMSIGGTESDPVKVMDWQQKYSNIGFCVDKIPIKNKELDLKNFESYAYKTKDNILKALQIRTKYKNFKFYAIIQGETLETYRKWKEIVDVEGVDGWCVKAVSNNLYRIVKTIHFASTLDKPIHFLGMGNLSKTILIFYAKNYFNQKISFDSSSWDVGSQYRSYILPFGLNSKISLKGNDFLIKDFSFCNCVYCKKLTEIRNNTEMESAIGPLISLHNLQVYVNVFDFLSKVYKNKEFMRQFARDTFSKQTAEKIILCFDYLDDLYEKGENYVNVKYEEDMFVRTGANQKSLF